ncbi:hypothetical protein FF011L_16290 [Roseimaritima multifibrata]|uniref:Uncharacterized protein n=1 Tax=Roseimaritima multifibrata TaxID=1930274 RepID=A0A517MDB1_9BACT|nr:hypothetical protein FF011L_16290 [Roseimaritima multifibrata]
MGLINRTLRGGEIRKHESRRDSTTCTHKFYVLSERLHSPLPYSIDSPVTQRLRIFVFCEICRRQILRLAIDLQ